MKVAAIVGVKNEVALIGHCLDHLYAIGVDRVVVEDCGSRDGTLDIVRNYPADRLSLSRFDESLDLDQEAWGRHEAVLARSTGADWVLFLDADEFWLPITGSVRHCLSAVTVDVLTVDRFNVVLAAEGPVLPLPYTPATYPQILLYVRPRAEFEARDDPRSSPPWISGVPMPKMAVRPQSISRVDAGHHAAIGLDGRPASEAKATDLVIAHLPFTTRQRFLAKVEGIRETNILQSAYTIGDTAWHWRRWVDLEEAGEIDSEFDRQIATPAELDRLREARTIASAAELLRYEL